MRRNNAQSSTGAEAVRKARAPKTAEAKAARAERKKALSGMLVDQLRDVAAKLDITGRSGMSKAELVAAILKAEGGGKKRKTYTLTAAIKTRTANKLSQRQGEGTFLLVLLDEGGGMVGELGPYAAARGAQVDAKSLLRRMVGDDAILSHEAAVEQIAEAPPGIKDMEKLVGGKVADGWIALDKETGDTQGEAWIVRIPKADSGLKKDSTIQALLRNNGRRRAAPRANPRVAFQTANGPVSFNARRNSAPAAAPRARGNAGKVQLTAHQNQEVDRLYEMGRSAISRIATVQPNAFTLWQHILIYVVGNGMNGQRFLSAVQHFDTASLLPGDQTGFRTVSTDAGVKVTPSGFVQALSTLRRAMGVA